MTVYDPVSEPVYAPVTGLRGSTDEGGGGTPANYVVSGGVLVVSGGVQVTSGT